MADPLADPPSGSPNPSVAPTKRNAGLWAILLGGLGVHKFLLGYTRAGIIMLAVSLVGWFLCAIPTVAMGIVGLIEGVLYLRKTDAEFAATYLTGKREWF